MKNQHSLKSAVSAINALYDSILNVYNTEFARITESAEKLSQQITQQKNKADHFLVFDSLSAYQTDHIQWLEDKVDQLSDADDTVNYWKESLHGLEKSITRINNLVNESFNDSIFQRTAEDS
ncbi:MAG: hypothetical protein JW956_03170, partial [Calditrichaceae bacterium]|nr:hypothetical protein [Calditrichaceae bacterium]